MTSIYEQCFTVSIFFRGIWQRLLPRHAQTVVFGSTCSGKISKGRPSPKLGQDDVGENGVTAQTGAGFVGRPYFIIFPQLQFGIHFIVE
jgi:hypothetical protein